MTRFWKGLCVYSQLAHATSPLSGRCQRPRTPHQPLPESPQLLHPAEVPNPLGLPCGLMPGRQPSQGDDLTGQRRGPGFSVIPSSGTEGASYRGG